MTAYDHQVSQFNEISEASSSDEVSLKEVIQKIIKWCAYLKKQWWKIAVPGIISGCIGFVYAWFIPITYTAKTTFVVEEGKSGGGLSSLGGLASLAGQFGVDVGGAASGGLFSGDNILLYFKSESLAKEVLLSKFDSTSNKSVADIYSEVYDLKEDWISNKKVGKVDFPPIFLAKSYTRLQDSLIQEIIKGILKKNFSVIKTDKKAGFIEVSTSMENEMLAKIYCDRIVKAAVDRYIKVKTQRQQTAVDKLQLRVDSVATLLGKKTIAGAALQTSSTTMDINPLYKTGTAVAVETTIRDKTMLATIFASVVQNLELAKFTLSQETPVIQIVDRDNFPLKSKKTFKTLYFLVGLALGACLSMIFLVAKKVLKVSLT